MVGAIRPDERVRGLGDRLNIGPYRIVRRLALGERSEVLLARVYGPYGFQRTVALKRLIGSHAHDPARLRQLAAEAIAYARLSHSAIVRLYDFVDLDGAPALVLEYVPGASLDALLATTRERGVRLGDDEIVYVGARVFAALAAAHGARHPETGEFSPVIHRNVSPTNVLVSTHGEVKLTDFGVARVAGVSDETPSGTLLGTYGYMAPEQILGDGVTVRADVYSAGLLLWEMLAGRHAFQRESLPELEILQAMASPRIAPIERIRPDLPPALCDAIGRALRPDPDARIGAREILDVLRGHVASAKARGGLADELGRARQRLSTVPDTAPPEWVDPDATSRHATIPPSELVPAARSPIRTETPTSIVAPVTLSRPVPFPRPPRRRTRLIFGYAILASVLLAPLLGGSRATPGASFAANRTTRSLAPSQPHPAAPVEVLRDALPASSSDPTRGIVETPGTLWNHRVFVDGLARGSGGDAIAVACGTHAVRLGSAGRLQWIQVPCGGRVRVER